VKGSLKLWCLESIFSEWFTEIRAAKFYFQWTASLKIVMSDSIFSEGFTETLVSGVYFQWMVHWNKGHKILFSVNSFSEHLLLFHVSQTYCATFLQRAQCSHCKRCISYNNSVRLSVRLSVCLSVCPSHDGIVSKRRHVARCSLHRWIAKCVWFCRNQKIFPRNDPFPLKFWPKVTYPLLKAASFDTFCLVAPQP